MNVQHGEPDQHTKKSMGQSEYLKIINITPEDSYATLQENGL